MPELHTAGLWDLLSTMELPLVPVLVEMERAGVLLDVDFLHGMSRELGQKLARWNWACQNQVGRPININSTQQLQTLLFGDLKLQSGKKTKTGHSTDNNVLEGLRGRPHVNLILEYRQPPS